MHCLETLERLNDEAAERELKSKFETKLKAIEAKTPGRVINLFDEHELASLSGEVK